jgi:diguanylate cyclase (GGDEF)-like protein
MRHRTMNRQIRLSTSPLRLTLLLGSILAVSFVSLSYINYVTISASVRNEIISSALPLTRENIYSDIVKDLLPPINVSASMAQDSFLINWALQGEREPERVIEYLRNVRNEFGYFSAFYVSTLTSAYYHSDGLLKYVNKSDDHDVWFYDFLSTGKPYDLDVDTNEAADNRLTIFVNYRVRDFDGRVIGVTGVGIELASFSGFLAERESTYGRKIYLASSDGVIQAHADPDVVERSSMYDRVGLAGVAAELLVESAEPINASFIESGVAVLVTARFMPETGWHIIVEQDEAEALAVPRRNLLRTLLVGLVTSVCILSISLLTVAGFQRRLRRVASTDELTGIANRREFDSAFRRFEYRFHRYSTPFSIAIIDIDRFKQVNDRNGHLVGDRVLIAVVEIMAGAIRPTDLLARWGGDEFILLTECTLAQAVELAGRIRADVDRADLAGRFSLEKPLTTSWGIAEFTEVDTIESAVSRADEALYDSKEGGRDAVSVRST